MSSLFQIDKYYYVFIELPMQFNILEQIWRKDGIKAKTGLSFLWSSNYNEMNKPYEMKCDNEQACNA